MKSTESNIQKSGKQHCCSLPLVQDRKLDDGIDPHREFLIRYIEKKWVNGTILKYHFLDAPAAWKGSDSQKSAVKNAFSAWKELGVGLTFTETSDPGDAQIRIAFEPGGSWSYVGRDAIDYVRDPKERTMNFGWDLSTDYGRDTALHEIGHALGFPHEHQNPNAGIVWDEEAVYSYFSGAPNFWDREQTFYNIIRKISAAEVRGSSWDKNSIMHYHFEAGLIKVPEEYQNRALLPESGLSEVDVEEVRKFYPKIEDEPVVSELEPFLSQLIDIAPGGQLDFVIRPTVNRKYTIQTFGGIDAVMVLFEEIDGEHVYLDGDDDSGTNLNAQIRAMLISGRTYFLKVRLYYAGASGQGSVMGWY
ncbi:regulatory protein [hydrothermal vent metagenome]|uniref:Regulatory protein n=1 Tax=hydrothermal vent metagenome TaxID=652676 RepID=A0A3B0Z7Q9_9ZZZZ